MSATFNTDRAKVIKAYSGKPGCMCGCNGTWTYQTDDENRWHNVNPRVVSRVYNKVMKSPLTKFEKLGDVNVAHIKTDDRVYAVYFTA